MLTVDDLITKSIESDRIVHAERRARLEIGLREVSDDEAENDGTIEFWGETPDGEPWRVHLDPPPPHDDEDWLSPDDRPSSAASTRP